MRAHICFLALLSALIWTASPARAQGAGATEQIHISMKTAAAPPGSDFTTPLYLEPAAEVKLKTLTVQVAYPKGVISFTKAEKGVLLQSGRFEVETATAPDAKQSGQEILKIEIKADPEDAKAALPKGLLLYLNFLISEKAEPAAIVLLPEVIAADALDGVQLSKARWGATKQVITIVGSDMKSILACFFFMH